MKLLGIHLTKHVQDLNATKHRSKESRNEHIAQSQGIIAITSSMYMKG